MFPQLVHRRKCYNQKVASLFLHNYCPARALVCSVSQSKSERLVKRSQYPGKTRYDLVSMSGTHPITPVPLRHGDSPSSSSEWHRGCIPWSNPYPAFYVIFFCGMIRNATQIRSSVFVFVFQIEIYLFYVIWIVIFGLRKKIYHFILRSCAVLSF